MIKDIRTEFWKIIQPKKAFSWQTLLWISIGCLVLSLLARFGLGSPELQRTFSGFSALMLAMSGVVWSIEQKPIQIRDVSLGPWMAGGLCSLLLYRFLSADNTTNTQQALYLACLTFPLSSIAIKIVQDFLSKPTLSRYKVPVKERVPLALWLLSHFLVTFWIRFAFTIQDWIDASPALNNSDIQAYGASMFVLPIDIFQ
jgi:hypothetical protein